MAKNIGEKLFKELNKQTEKVIYYSHAEDVSPNIIVHEIRKSFKRIRALLHFYRIPENEYAASVENQLIKFGKALSPVRNSCVNISVLEKIAKEKIKVPESKLVVVKEILTEKNKELLRIKSAENKLETEIDNFMQAFEVNLGNKLALLDSEQFIQQLSISYGNGFKTYAEEYVFESWKSLHDLRKELKHLNYQYKFLAAQHIKYFIPKSHELAAITQSLGDDHDLFVFLKELKRNNYELNSSEIEIIGDQVNHIHQMNLQEFKTVLKQFFAKKPLDYTEEIKSFFTV